MFDIVSYFDIRISYFHFFGRGQKKLSLYKCTNVHFWYEKRVLFDRIDRIKLISEKELKIFYFFGILPLSMFTFD